MFAAFAVMNVRAAVAEPDPETVFVIGTSPEDTRSISPDEIASSHALSAAQLVDESIGSVFLSDTESSPFQEDLYFRGFDASPVLGTSEGLAIYQNGTRINQRFGDTVLWDLLPSFAVARVDVVPGSDPLFGLNALGGAIVFNMKTGFDAAPGAQLELAAGSYGRARAVAQLAGRSEDEAYYFGASAVDDSGWRRSSQSKLYQAYGDFDMKLPRAEFGVDVSLASDTLNENGAVPVQDSPTAAFAIPDTARNEDFFLQARGDYSFDADTMLRGDAYLRATHIETANGEASGFMPCSQDTSILCDADGGPLRSIAGRLIPSSVGGTGTSGLETISTTALGSFVELDISGSLWGAENSLALGSVLDYATTGFGSATKLGNLAFQDGGTTTDSLGIGLGGTDWNVRLGTISWDEAVYAQDTIALSPALSLEFSARGHVDRIGLTDRLGASLTGDHTYLGVNPAAELSWNGSGDLKAYAEFEQSNRTPTPAELSCANPAEPCLFPLSFISDPSLREVVARSIDMGVKGRAEAGAVALDWSLDLYGSRNQDDIIFESAGPSLTSGYFANVGTTQRLGGELGIRAVWGQLDIRGSYGYVHATFETAFAERSPNNPHADANGNIFVKPGDRLPDVPGSTAKLSIGYAATPQLYVAVRAMAESSQFLRGDEANLNAPLPGFVTFSAECDYQISPHVRLYVEGENLFDTRYATFGLYGDATGRGAFPQFTNPRFVVPSAPLAFWAGLQLIL